MEESLNRKSPDSKKNETIFWTGICMKDRITGIQEAETIIDSLGFITNYMQFSDLAISLNIEIETCKVHKLYKALSEKFKMYALKELDVKEDDISPTQIFFNISFAEGHGDLKIEVISVPG